MVARLHEINNIQVICEFGEVRTSDVIITQWPSQGIKSKDWEDYIAL